MPDRSTCWRWSPEENCYCGGPEEIYPHRVGTGRYCRPTNTPPPAPPSRTAASPTSPSPPTTRPSTSEASEL